MPPELPPIEEFARTLPFSYASEEAPDLARYASAFPLTRSDIEAVATWTKQFMEGEGGNDTVGLLKRLCVGIQEKLTYAMRFEPARRCPLSRSRRAAAPSRLCPADDRMLSLARPRGRFITGYLYDPALDARPCEATTHAYPHAWMEFYSAGPGWSNSIRRMASSAASRLIRVAVARDPEQSDADQGQLYGPARGYGECSGGRTGAHSLPPTAVPETPVPIDPVPSQAPVPSPELQPQLPPRGRYHRSNPFDMAAPRRLIAPPCGGHFWAFQSMGAMLGAARSWRGAPGLARLAGGEERVAGAARQIARSRRFVSIKRFRSARS